MLKSTSSTTSQVRLRPSRRAYLWRVPLDTTPLRTRGQSLAGPKQGVPPPGRKGIAPWVRGTQKRRHQEAAAQPPQRPPTLASCIPEDDPTHRAALRRSLSGPGEEG